MEEREVAIALVESARERLSAGELTLAAKLADRARDIFIEVSEAKSACGAAAVAGHARMRGGDLAGARAAFEWVKAEAQERGLVPQELSASTDLGALMELGGDLEGALALHQDILSKCRFHADEVGTANAAGNVGRLLTRMVRHDEAEGLLQESLDRFQTLGHNAGQANAHICLGDLRRAVGESAQAEVHFERASELTDAAELAPLRAMALLNIGHLRRERGDLAGALGSFTSSAGLAESLGDAQGVARARLAEGMVLADRAEPQEALDCFEQAESAFVEIGQPGAALAASVNKAAVQCRLGKLKEGQEVLESARTVLSHIGDQQAVHEVGFALCEVALGLGDAGRAEALLAETPTEDLGARLQLRGQLVSARLAMRGLLFEQSAAAAVLPDELDATPGERFAVDLVQAELAILSGAPDAEHRVDALEALADATVSPRELAAARGLRGQFQLWTGQLTLARPTYLRVRALWRELHEPIPEMQAQAALWWIDLLAGEVPSAGEARVVESEAREIGLVDLADSIACLASAIDAITARDVALGHRLGGPGQGDSKVHADSVLDAAAPLIFRGNRLAAAVALTLAAGATGEPALRDRVVKLAGHSRLTPINAGSWRRD
ncbi:MAG: tetratricopeptide repeat protein [Myxococcales bacterium]|nr:tetratricopeptide repeat protein [Myxococcales bacterium]